MKKELRLEINKLASVVKNRLALDYLRMNKNPLRYK